MYLNFERELDFVKKNVENKHIEKVIRDIEILTDYINSMKDKGFSREEILDSMNDDIITTLTTLTRNSGTEKLQRESYSLGILLNNPMLLDRIYREAKDIDLTSFNVKVEQEENDREEDVWQKFIVKLNLKYLRNVNFKDELSQKCSEKDLLVLYMEKRKEDINKEIRRRYIELLLNAGRFMKKYQFLNSDLEIYNQNMRKLALHDLMYSLDEKDKKSPNDLSLEELFSKDYLEKLNLEQLAILNLYWQNRLTKDLEVMINGIFMKKNVRLKDKKNLKDVLKNYVYRKEICLNVYKKVSKTSSKGKKYLKYKIDENNPDFIEKYNKYFNDELSEKDTDFMKDMSDIAIYENVQINAYKVKMDMFKMLLQKELKNSKKITNWGIIEEREPKKDFCLIGIDFPGMNLPIRVHIRKDELKEFLHNINGNTVLPMYKGDEDFKYEDRKISSYILVPLTKEKESVIIKKASESIPIDLRYLLYQHLGNLVTIKTKKVKKIYSEKYINLDTEKKGIIRNGVFVEDTVDNRGNAVDNPR